MNKQQILDPFQNVVPGSTAILDLSKFIGNSVLEKLSLQLGGTTFTKSMMTSIVLRGNGKVLWETTGPTLDAANQYLTPNADATFLKMDFYDRRAISPLARSVGAFDLGKGTAITSLRLEIAISSSAVAPTLTGFADVSPSLPIAGEEQNRGLVSRRTRVVQNIAAAGQWVSLAVPQLEPSGGGTNIRRLHIFSANLTDIKTVRNGVVEHELTRLQNEYAQKDNGRTPQANLVVFDPVQDGQLAQRTFDTRPAVSVNSAQIYAKFSAAETITMEADVLLAVRDY
jgi:hypothetical protein